MEVLKDLLYQNPAFQEMYQKIQLMQKCQPKRKQTNEQNTTKSAGPGYIHTQVLEKLKCEKVKLLNSL